MADDKKLAKSQETPYDRFEKLLRKVISVPKKEIDRREAEWQKQHPSKRTHP